MGGGGGVQTCAGAITANLSGKRFACPTVVLQWYHSGVTVVLQWCYSGVTVELQFCYSGVTLVLQCGVPWMQEAREDKDRTPKSSNNLLRNIAV